MKKLECASLLGFTAPPPLILNANNIFKGLYEKNYFFSNRTSFKFEY